MEARLQRALVTGGAGFIGSHLVDRLMQEGWHVTVVDNFDRFYAPQIKRENIAAHARNPNFRLLELDISDDQAIRDAFLQIPDYRFEVIVHLAAKAGVLPSVLDPIGYQKVNVSGTQNLLELARALKVPQFVFSSSSSVYGLNPRVPWREEDTVLLPISPYASTKVSGELLGHVYSHLYKIRFIALRLFTVYGPRQRPDLAIHKFAGCIREGRRIPLYGTGTTRRDYTYVDDVVSGIRAAMGYTGSAYEVINLGNSVTVALSELVQALESVLFQQAALEYLPEQPGDVPQTWADISKARRLLSYNPVTPLTEGLRHFADWLTANESPERFRSQPTE